MTGRYSYETGEKRHFQTADYVVFGATLTLSASVGLYYAIRDRQKNTTEEFLLGGRKMYVIPVAMSLLSSFISAITLLGTPVEMYTHNTMFWYISVGFLLTIIGAAHIFLPVFYKLGITSTFEYIELRFGSVVRAISSIVYITWMLLFMAIILYGPSIALNAVSGLSLWGSVVAVSFVCTFYTTLGGMKAVLWTDTLQMCIMFAGLFSLLIKGSMVMGGFSNAWRIADEYGRIQLAELSPNPTVRHSVWNVVIGASMFWCAIYGINQAQVQRTLSVSTLRKAQTALWLNVPGMFLVQTVTCMVGVVMYAFYHKCDPVKFGLIKENDQLIPLFAVDILSDYAGLPGLMMSCVFSGSLSSISSSLNAMAAVVLKDFVMPLCCPVMTELRATLLSKLIVVIFGLASLFLTFIVSQMGGVLQACYLSFGILGGPLLGLFVLGILFPWANKWGALAGHVTSLALVSWIGIGAQLNIPIPSLPVRQDGCNWNLTTVEGHNNTMPTTLVTQTNLTTSTGSVDDSDPLMKLYSLSYMWYTGLAILTTLVVGLPVSFLTGYTRPRTLNPRLICPFFDVFFWFLPEKIRKPLRFGVRFGECDESPHSPAKTASAIDTPLPLTQSTTFQPYYDENKMTP